MKKKESSPEQIANMIEKILGEAYPKKRKNNAKQTDEEDDLIDLNKLDEEDDDVIDLNGPDEEGEFDEPDEEDGEEYWSDGSYEEDRKEYRPYELYEWDRKEYTPYGTERKAAEDGISCETEKDDAEETLHETEENVAEEEIPYLTEEDAAEGGIPYLTEEVTAEEETPYAAEENAAEEGTLSDLEERDAEEEASFERKEISAEEETVLGQEENSAEEEMSYESVENMLEEILNGTKEETEEEPSDEPEERDAEEEAFELEENFAEQETQYDPEEVSCESDDYDAEEDTTEESDEYDNDENENEYEGEKYEGGCKVEEYEGEYEEEKYEGGYKGDEDENEYEVEGYEGGYEEEEYEDEYEEDIEKRPKKKKKHKRGVALWKKLLLTLECLILVAIIIAAVYLAQSGLFEESDVVFGDLAVEELYYVAGQGESATFTIQAADSEKEMLLCDGEGSEIATMHDDGQDGDETAGDGIYTCVLSIEDTDIGAQSYYVKEAKTTSNEVTIYVFQTLSAEELESASGICDEVWSALREIEDGYADASGYVTADDFTDLFAEVETYLKNLTADGTVIRYVVEDESAYIKFASGLSLCYEPILEDTFSGEDDVQLTVTYLQPGEGSYAADSRETLESAMAQVENLESGETCEGSEVTLSMVKSLASDQVIIWYGHGTWSSVTGSGLVLDVTLENSAGSQTEENVSESAESTENIAEENASEGLTAEEQADLFKDYLTTVYLEDGKQHLAVTAAYVAEYCGDLSNNLIFLSACDSGKDSRLADAFLACGAAAVLSFSDSVLCEYASGVIDGVLQYMLRAWPESEWFYTLEQALERVEAVLGENDSVWLENYADTTEKFQNIVACGAEPVLLTGVSGSEETKSGTDSAEMSDTEASSAEASGAEMSGVETSDTETTDAESGNTEPVGTETDSTETNDSGIRLSTEKGALRGTTCYYAESPEPAAGATVSIWQGGELYMELVTDENGEYAVSALPVGTYDITFSLTGYGDYYQENVVVFRDETTSADGYFFANNSITGTVIDALTGKPLAEAEVELLIGDGETIYKQTVLTDENGNYTFDLTEESKSAALSELVKYFEGTDYSDLLEGSSVMVRKQLLPEGLSGYTMGISGSGVVLFEKDGYVDEVIEITLTGFDSPNLRTAELTPQVEIGGYVYDANGNALGGVTITAVVTGDGSSSVQDDQDGESSEEGNEEDAEEGDGENVGESEEESNGDETENATVSTAATGDTVNTETDVDGYYSLAFDMGSKITIRVTYTLSGYDTKTVEYEIDSSMVSDGKVKLTDVSLTRSKQLVTGTSYAASVISFESGNPWTTMSDAMNPVDALGEPDYSDYKNAVTLGAGGVLVLGFDVDFCNGDGIDIYIYEVGDDVETTLVEVSRDGESWVNVGTVNGSTSGIDLEGMVSASSTFRYIRLTDLGSHTGGWWPGADIDAVAVTHYMQ